jgi:hypothetical protein
MKLPKLLGGRGHGSDWDDPQGEPSVELMRHLSDDALSPSAETMRRMQAGAMAAFRQAQVERREAPSRLRHTAPIRFRIAMAAGVVALLTVSGAGLAAAESGPGQPFYRTRLAIEAWFLPPAGSDARLAADLDRAQARLDDARTAAAGRDWNAEQDALGAYVQVVSSITLPRDQAARDQLRQRLTEQLATLASLDAGAQPGTDTQVRRATEDVEGLLESAGGPSLPTPGGGPQASPSNGQGGQGGQSGGNSGGNGSGGPNESSGPNVRPSPSPASNGGPGGKDPGGSGQGGPGGPG